MNVSKVNKKWISFKSRTNDTVYLRKDQVIWLVKKTNDMTWIVVEGEKETYWEVGDSPEDILEVLS